MDYKIWNCKNDIKEFEIILPTLIMLTEYHSLTRRLFIICCNVHCSFKSYENINEGNISYKLQ